MRLVVLTDLALHEIVSPLILKFVDQKKKRETRGGAKVI